MTFNKRLFSFRLTALTFSFIFLSSTLQAAEINSETLVASCGELVVIYNKNEEKSLYASISTSVAEAMRAGICRGMIEEHERQVRRTYGSGCSNSWREQAWRIARYGLESNHYGIEDLLDDACNG